MTPEEEEGLRKQVDAIYTLPDDAWVDAFCAELDARDAGKPADVPDDQFLNACDQYPAPEISMEQAQALLDRLEPPKRQPTLYDWALDAGLMRLERDTARIRFWTWALAAVVVSAIVLKVAGAL